MLNREQAKIAWRYISAIFRENPDLAPLVVREADGVIELANRVEILTVANNFRSIRGRNAVAAIFDEVAFSPNEDSAPVEELQCAVASRAFAIVVLGARALAQRTTRALGI